MLLASRVVARVDVRLHGVFSEFAGGVRHATVDAATIGEALDALARLHPELRERLRDEHGRVREHVGIFANAERMAALGGERAALRDGDTLHVVPAISGGSFREVAA